GNVGTAGAGGAGGQGLGTGGNGGLGGGAPGGGGFFNNNSNAAPTVTLSNNTASHDTLTAGTGGHAGQSRPPGAQKTPRRGRAGVALGGGIMLWANTPGNINTSSITNAALDSNVIRAGSGGTGGAGALANGGLGGLAAGGGLYNNSHNTSTPSTLTLISDSLS